MTQAGREPRRGAIICFTRRGAETALRARDFLEERGFRAGVWCKKKDIRFRDERISILEGALGEWTGGRFRDSQVILFVGATGIAVRAIAPFLVSKKQDPAVLCADESGRFVISLLSGHIGGANELALGMAESLGAVPVITTATDLNGKFAVDVFARANGLWISDMTLAKEVSARLLDGETVGLESDYPLEGAIPPELTAPERATSDLVIRIASGIRRRGDGKRELVLIPANLTLGLGCRQGKTAAELEAFVREVLAKEGLSFHGIKQVCSIDLKAEEKGICDLCAAYHLPYRTFSAQELAACPGEFTGSAFVEKTTGVDSVCERSAVLGSGGGRLLLRKRAQQGMTAAAAAGDWRAYFE